MTGSTVAARARREPTPNAGGATHPVIRILPERHKRARLGHPWIFSNEIAMTAEAKALAPGALVTLIEDSGAPVGTATFNPHSLIAARVLSPKPDAQIARGFFAARIGHALALRERLYSERCYRLVHSEADGLPGLVIDRMDRVVVVQTNTAGMDRLAEEIIAAIEETLAPAAIVLKNDSPVRALEGLNLETRVATGAIAGPVEVVENGLTFCADVLAGQKTGWFFDQRENRALVAKLARGQRVLDSYAHSGGFGLACAAHGASAVLCVDRSEDALALGLEAARRNGLEANVSFVRAEAFADLERRGGAGPRFDIVIADPPAFVKSKKDLGPGARGYRKLTRLAARLVAPGGFLFVASCSHHVDRALFAENVHRGLVDAARMGRILAETGAAPDHPVHPALPESAYLKATLLQLD